MPITSGGVLTGGNAGTVTVNYSVTNGSGCTTVVTKSVTVNALPVVAAIGGSATVCTGSTSNYTNTTGGGTCVGY